MALSGACVAMAGGLGLSGYGGSRSLLMLGCWGMIGMLSINFIAVDLRVLGLPTTSMRIVFYLLMALAKLLHYLSVAAFFVLAILAARRAALPNPATAPLADVISRPPAPAPQAVPAPIGYQSPQTPGAVVDTPWNDLLWWTMLFIVAIAALHALLHGHYLVSHLDLLTGGGAGRVFLFGQTIPSPVLWLFVALVCAAWTLVCVSGYQFWSRSTQRVNYCLAGLSFIFLATLLSFIDFPGRQWKYTSYAPVVTETAGELANLVIAIVLLVWRDAPDVSA